MDQNLVIGIAVFAGFVFSIVVHEVAHAVTALWLGDPTARDLGRITLNPIPHVDPMMSIVMPLMLYLSGLPMFGGAKPVPVIRENLRRPYLDMAIIALAGPVSNLLLAVIFAATLNLVPALAEWKPHLAENFVKTVVGIVVLNAVLAFFNLVPIPPLDGSRVAAVFLPRHLARYVYDYQVQIFGMLLIFLLLLLGMFRYIQPWISGFLQLLEQWVVVW